MGKQTGIPWTDHTFNSWRGCTKVSAGCANCYAETMSKRNHAIFGVWGDAGNRVVAAESYWRQPLAWDREAKAAGVRRRVFCASLADVFEDWRGPMLDAKGRPLYHVDLDMWSGSGGGIAWEADPPIKIGKDRRMLTMADVRERLFDVIDATTNLDWLMLTKRPENGPRMLPDRWSLAPPPNVWLGTTVENRAAAASRIPHLLNIPAAVRFLSAEPLLEDLGDLDLAGIHWVIFGGESGPGARPCDVAWIRDGVRRCREVGVACFVKQLGARPYNSQGAADYPEASRRVTAEEAKSPAGIFTLAMTLELMTMRLRHPAGADPAEWPADLRVQEFPGIKGE